jgi:hypothetical protein
MEYVFGPTGPLVRQTNHDVGADLVVPTNCRLESWIGLEQLLQLLQVLILGKLGHTATAGDVPPTIRVASVESLVDVDLQVSFQLGSGRCEFFVAALGLVIDLTISLSFDGTEVEVCDLLDWNVKKAVYLASDPGAGGARQIGQVGSVRHPEILDASRTCPFAGFLPCKTIREPLRDWHVGEPNRVERAPSLMSRKQPPSHCILNPNRGEDWIIVLPTPHHDPSCVYEQSVSFVVPLEGAADLPSPEVSVRPRDSVVLRAAVPEATVQEHRHPRCREHHVGGPSYGLDGSTVDEVAQPARMNCAAECKFGTRIPPTVGPHARANPRRGCPGPPFSHGQDASGEPDSSANERNLGWRT